MPFQMEQNEIDRIPNLPKWAQDMITRMGRIIDRQDTRIADLTMDTNANTNVSISKFGGDIALPQNTKIEFKLPDTVMTHNGREYKEHNTFTVSIMDDVCNGGKLLEVHGYSSMLIESRATNVIHIRPTNRVYGNFVRYSEVDDVEA